MYSCLAANLQILKRVKEASLLSFFAPLLYFNLINIFVVDLYSSAAKKKETHNYYCLGLAASSVL